MPLTPTGYGDSPYQSLGACAGNHYLIDLDRLADEGLLKKEEIQNISWGSNPARVDFGAMYAHRMNVLRLAFQRFAPDEPTKPSWSRTGAGWKTMLCSRR